MGAAGQFAIFSTRQVTHRTRREELPKPLEEKLDIPLLYSIGAMLGVEGQCYENAFPGLFELHTGAQSPIAGFRLTAAKAGATRHVNAISGNKLTFLPFEVETGNHWGLVAAGLLDERRPIERANEAGSKSGEELPIATGSGGVEQRIGVEAAHTQIIKFFFFYA